MGEKGNLLGAGLGADAGAEAIGGIGSGVGAVGGEPSGLATERVESVGGLGSDDGTTKGAVPSILDAARSVPEPSGAEASPIGDGGPSGPRH